MLICHLLTTASHPAELHMFQTFDLITVTLCCENDTLHLPVHISQINTTAMIVLSLELCYFQPLVVTENKDFKTCVPKCSKTWIVKH